MQNFQQILTEAAQLKEYQLKQQRKQFQKLPQFIKSGLNYSKKYEQIRKQNFLYQLRISINLRKKGNAHFKQNQFEEAQNKYQEALSIFKFISSKSFQNMKDADISYQQFDQSQLSLKLRDQYNQNLSAIYLNICHCLAKLNRKEEALYSADLALKIKQTAKGHYKKAQAYLLYINRDESDFKLAILQLKQAYSLSKDNFFIEEMKKAKTNYQSEKNSQKKWFKFMFDKNKEKAPQIKDEKKQEKKQRQQKPDQKTEMMKMFEEEVRLSEEDNEEKFRARIKEYCQMDDKQWLAKYNENFLEVNGNKFYSLMNIYGYGEYIGEYRSYLARCLSSQNKNQSKQNFERWLEWLRTHPIKQIIKYIERYDLQLKIIKEQRDKTKGIQISKKCQKADKKSEQNQKELEFISEVKQFTNNNSNKQKQVNKQYKNMKLLAIILTIFIILICFIVIF